MRWWLVFLCSLLEDLVRVGAVLLMAWAVMSLLVKVAY